MSAECQNLPPLFAKKKHTQAETRLLTTKVGILTVSILLVHHIKIASNMFSYIIQENNLKKKM